MGTFAFLTNTGTNEVSVVDMERRRLLDLDPAYPGFGKIPVGQLPEVVTASRDGCKALSVNRASCDFSLIDSTRVLSEGFIGVEPSNGEGALLEPVVPRTASGFLQARPQEAVFLGPSATSTTTCSADDTWQMAATFPGCDLVAILEMPSGHITQSFYVRDGVFENAGTDPICPVECGASAGADTGTTAQDRPGALALDPSGKFLLVAGESSPSVGVLDVSGSLVVPLGTSGATLAEDPQGVSRLRFSVDPYGKTANNATSVPSPEYVYAVARDASVRVLFMDAGGPGGLALKECDVNAVGEGGSATSGGCTLIGQAPRRVTARGPGLRLPSSTLNTAGPVPIDVAFATISPLRVSNVSGEDRTPRGTRRSRRGVWVCVGQRQKRLRGKRGEKPSTGRASGRRAAA